MIFKSILCSYSAPSTPFRTPWLRRSGAIKRHGAGTCVEAALQKFSNAPIYRKRACCWTHVDCSERVAVWNFKKRRHLFCHMRWWRKRHSGERHTCEADRNIICSPHSYTQQPSLAVVERARRPACNHEAPGRAAGQQQLHTLGRRWRSAPALWLRQAPVITVLSDSISRGGATLPFDVGKQLQGRLTVILDFAVIYGSHIQNGLDSEKSARQGVWESRSAIFWNNIFLH